MLRCGHVAHDRLTIACRSERAKQYTAHVNEYLKKTIFGQPVRSQVLHVPGRADDEHSANHGSSVETRLAVTLVSTDRHSMHPHWAENILAYYPGNSLNLMYAQRNPRWEDFDYTYLDELGGNPMCWLGNGYTKADYDGSSRTTYLDPAHIDYPPVPAPIEEKPLTNGVNGHAETAEIGIFQTPS